MVVVRKPSGSHHRSNAGKLSKGSPQQKSTATEAPTKPGERLRFHLNMAVRHLAEWQTSHDPELLNKSLNAVAYLAADVVAVSKDPVRQKQRFYGFFNSELHMVPK
jgi:hypothetical protein